MAELGGPQPLPVGVEGEMMGEPGEMEEQGECQSCEGRRPPPPSRGVWALALILADLAVLSITPTPALAHITHLFDSTTTSAFGSIPGPLGLAIDESDGSVYVAALNSGTISKFTSDGKPVSSFGGGTGQISGFSYGTWGLAVDQSSHDIYVTDDSNGVHKFDSNGNPVTSFGSSGQVSVNTPIGVGVDPSNGDIYVASTGQNQVDVFTSSGTPVTQFSTDKLTFPLGVAIDASGNVYVDSGGYGGDLSSAGLERFTESGTPQGVVESGAFQGIAVDPASGDIYGSQVAANAKPAELDQYIPGAASQIDTFGAGTVNDPWEVAINGKTGEVYVADYSSSSVDAFGPLVTLADVTTDPPLPANVGHRAAKISGEIDPAGGPPVTECYFEYGTSTEYTGGKVPCESSIPITTRSEVSTILSGLTPLSTYHYRLAARNEHGVSYGQDQTVTPPAVFGVNTLPATGITATGAKLNGAFQIDPESGDTRYYFEWGETPSYGNSTPAADAGSTSAAKEVSAAIAQLTFYTAYHYRIAVSNSLGTNYGPDQTFYSALPSLPSVDRTSSSNVSSESATLEAEVNPGFGPTIVRFEYGQSVLYGSRTPPSEPVGPDGADHLVSRSVAGLQSGRTYHYRVIAINFSGRTTGPDATFNTTALPEVASTAASAVSQTTATVTAQIKPGFSTTSFRVEYGTTTSYGQSTQSSSVASDNSPHTVSAHLAGLAPATTYHYRVVASNEVGTAEGPDETLTTTARPEEGKKSTHRISCRRGRVLRHGKCVKKRRPRSRNRSHGVHNRRGGR